MTRAPLRDVVNAVAYATRPRFVLEDDLFKRTRRLSPSAGALHPIDVVIVDWCGSSRVWRYRPLDHELESLALQRRDAIKGLLRELRSILPYAHGTTLVFLGDSARVANVYDHSASLLWRDAGALLQTLFLSAEAFRLGFCPVGILGHELPEALGLREQLVAAGVAMIGRSQRNG